MKKITYLIFLFLTGCYCSESFSQNVTWEEINCPSTEEIRCMTYFEDGKIFIADWGSGIYKSEDIGVTWEKIFSSGGYSVLYREIIPGEDNNLYVAARNYLFVLDQSGNSVYYKYFNTDVYSLALNSQLHLYVATEDSGIARTTDGGESWEVNILYPDSNYHFTSIAIDDSDNIYVGTSVGIFKSSDYGETWMKKNTGLLDLYIFDIMCASNNYLFLTGNDGIVRSTNGGLNWQYVNNGSGGGAYKLEEDNNANLYFGSGAIYKSTNWGNNWIKIFQTNAGGNSSILPIDDILLIGSDYNGFYRADLSDSSLTSMAINKTSIYRFVENDTGEYFAKFEGGIYGGGISMSTDSGQSWKLIGSPWSPEINNFWNIPNVNLFTGIWGKVGIIKNRKNTFYWTLENSDSSSPNTVLYEPDSNYIYVSTTGDNYEYYGGVYRGKLDTNSTLFEKVTTGLPAYPDNILIAKNSRNQLFAALDHDGVFRSDDRGLSWQLKVNGLTDLSIRLIKVDKDDNIFVCTYTNIFRSIDDGENWTVLNNNFNYYADDIEVDTLNNLYVVIYRQVYKSTDHGFSWSEFGDEFNSVIRGIFINESEYMFVYTNKGIYKSDNTITGLNQITNFRPNEFRLSQNYPNPFNPTTNIEFQIAEPGYVTLKVYDILGNEVATLVNKEKPVGTYKIKFDGSSLSSGIYFYQIKAGDFTGTKKLILIK